MLTLKSIVQACFKFVKIRTTFKLSLTFLCMVGLVAACEDRKDNSPKVIVSNEAAPAPEGVYFRKTDITLNKRLLKVEVAQTDEQRSQGLMYRKHMPTDEGMLFVFDSPQPLSFWMKNTLIPLSIAFFDENKVLINIEDMYPQDDSKPVRTYLSKKPAKYALEVNLGWFEKNKIKVGDRLTL